MPPHDANSKDGNPLKLTVGKQFPVKVTKMKSQRLTQWVPFWRDTKFYCAACFTACADPAQHFKQSATCGYSSAVTYLLHSLEQNHYAGDFHPDPSIISIMLEDDTCPMHPLDVLVQPSHWDPTQNFSMDSFENKVHVNQELSGKCFKTLYDEYVARDRIKPIVDALPVSPLWAFPDHVDRASQSANSVSQYVIHRKREYDRIIDEEVEQLVAEQVNGERQRLKEKFDRDFKRAVGQEIDRLVNQGTLTLASQDKNAEENRRVRPRTASLTQSPSSEESEAYSASS